MELKRPTLRYIRRIYTTHTFLTEAFESQEVAMLLTLRVATVFLVSVAMALCLAHALELPGKLRLDKQAYLTVQPIYYPGFTVGGLSEILGILATVALLFLTSSGAVRLALCSAR
jgi:hypothetical protein